MTPHRFLPLVAAAALALAACGEDNSDVPTTSGAPAPASSAPASSAAGGSTATSGPTSSSGTSTGGSAGPAAGARTFSGALGAADSGGHALSYDATAAPVGAKLGMTVTSSGGTTTYKLQATGMQPSRGYAVHAHVNACGPTGEAAGPHFQHNKDPKATPTAPSSDPAFANPHNEVWLTLTTDAHGAGTADATVPFTFSDSAPQSIVVHADPTTMTDPGKAGMAGARIACLDTPLV